MEALLPLAVILVSTLTGLLIFTLHPAQHRARTVLNLGGALLKLALVMVLLSGVFQGHEYTLRMPLLEGVDLLLVADPLALLFLALSALLWLVTTIYAIGYLEGSPHRSRFFGFFSLCVSATAGIALAGNLLTFLIFFELLTLTTWPLVIHRGTRKALHAGAIYLAYTLGGGALLLFGTIWLHTLVGPIAFTPGGVFGATLPAGDGTLRTIAVLLLLGVGVKTALVPLHGWLPRAMVAPAPVSALLHAVAVVKAGAFGVVRILYDVLGIDLALALGIAPALALAAAITILWGSIRALAQNDIKRRLAFSTVSQVSYIVLGAAIAGPLALVGGLTHLVHQGLMKITLFFCAGNLAETLGIHKVTELNGTGRRMPLTMAAFTLGALGMIGLPPLAGFVSKWYLGLGALEAHQWWWVGVLVGSSVLNAAYFLPPLYRIWFLPPPPHWPDERPIDGRFETTPTLLLPTVFVALASLLAGLFAASAISPLAWAELIVRREYFQ
jgi:multicomponent Na+:H+ antiporter subunit D